MTLTEIDKLADEVSDYYIPAYSTAQKLGAGIRYIEAFGDEPDEYTPEETEAFGLTMLLKERKFALKKFIKNHNWKYSALREFIDVLFYK